jgi:transcriptional regulator with GAF, ATPase, and Fis domain
MNTNDFFHHATVRICGSLDIEKALYDCWKYLRQHIPADGMYINMFRPDVKAIRFIARADAGGGNPMNEQVAITDDMCRTLLEPDRPRIRILADLDDDPVTGRVAGTIYPVDTSILLMRMMIEDRHLGVVGLHAHGRGRFHSGHGTLLSLLHEPFAIATANALRHRKLLRTNSRLTRENQILREQLSESRSGAVIGDEGGLQTVMKRVAQVAPLSNTVLLLGETGVGKEVIASVIHARSPRHDGPFIKVNCGAIPESLMDSELFGHERGAFTGATHAKKGVFEQAHGGTLFLDEIGELPQSVQVRLLRVLQNHQVTRVGGSMPRDVDIRIVTATHRNLQKMVELGSFREDLWFRLNVFPVTIPPLRERPQDIPDLVTWFSARAARRLSLSRVPDVPPEEMQRLMAYSWPGNVRELENCVERAIILSGGATLHFDWLAQTPPRPQPCPDPQDAPFSPRTLDTVMANHIAATLEQTKGKIHGPGGAAELLGLNPSTLRSRMKKLGICREHG